VEMCFSPQKPIEEMTDSDKWAIFFEYLTRSPRLADIKSIPYRAKA